MKKYEVVDNKQETREIDAASVKLNENQSRVTFYDDDGEPVASFVGSQSFRELTD